MYASRGQMPSTTMEEFMLGPSYCYWFRFHLALKQFGQTKSDCQLTIEFVAKDQFVCFFSFRIPFCHRFGIVNSHSHRFFCFQKQQMDCW